MNLFNKWKSSIVFRLTFLYASIFALSFLTIFFILYYLVSTYLQKTRDQFIFEESKELKRLALASNISREDLSRALEEEAVAVGTNSIFYCLRSKNGDNLAFSNSGAWEGMLHDNRHFPWDEKRDAFFETVNSNNQEYPCRVFYYLEPSGTILQIVVSLKDDILFLNHFVRLFSFAYLIIIVICCITSYLMLKTTLGPVHTMTQIAREVSIKNLSQKIPIKGHGKDELGELAGTLNEMLGKIEHLIQVINETNDNLAHDLRSPIGRIRTNIEVALLRERSNSEYQEVLQNCLAESNSLLEIVNKMLEISEVESGVLPKDEEINLSAVVEDVADAFRIAAEFKNISFSDEIYSPLLIQGNHKNVKRAFVNVIDNAIKYTSAGGKINIKLYETQDYAVFSVEDSGVGIANEDLNKIFKRFYRSENSYAFPGFGLGLALVKAVVESHQGFIQVNSNLGHGSVFIIYLPKIKKN